jgi:endonuclease YncB( thermonuclease family)
MHYEALAVFLFVLGVAAMLVGGGCQGADETSPRSTPLVRADVRAEDGDTIRFVDGSGRAPIRLLQINAPDLDECYGRQAHRYLSQVLARGERLSIIEDTTLKADRYERQWLYLRSAARNINVQMVRRGYAVPYFMLGERGDFADRISEAAQDAEDHRRGLWGRCPGEIPAQK